MRKRAQVAARAAEELGATLLRGFTTVRDCGELPRVPLAMQSRTQHYASGCHRTSMHVCATSCSVPDLQVQSLCGSECCEFCCHGAVTDSSQAAMNMCVMCMLLCAGGADYGLAQAVEEGFIVGPRLLFVGHALSQTGGHGDFRGKGEDCVACGAALR